MRNGASEHTEQAQQLLWDIEGRLELEAHEGPVGSLSVEWHNPI
jgi:hypothetical protein